MKNQVRLPSHIKPERYKIKLKPDLEEFTFTGEETIYLLLEKPTKQIILHSAELEIESAEFIHANQDIWAGPEPVASLRYGVKKITYDKKSETATFTFPKLLQKGKGRLKLIFKGILNDKMRGFYRSKYIYEGREKHLATTQFESTDARRAFPCFDEPSQKAVFDVTLQVPSHTTAISNTIESTILEHESGYKLIEFAPTPKMSTYLLAFIVGEFEYIEGKVTSKASHPRSNRGSINNDRLLDSHLRGNDSDVLVRVFTTPGKKGQAKFALDVAIKCLDFYEDYFGIKYPLPVLDLIAIPDFAAGAMENWGAVTYRESALLIDEQASSTANKQWVALVIAHELAHQWFGNLVTMEWWTHLWLNEGFAVFIEYLAIDKIFPKWDIWKQFVATEMHEAFELDCLNNTHPVEVEVGHPSEISEIFDEISYAKGSVVLRMLWKYLGEKDFQKGLHCYLKKHQYANAQTRDLWNSLEEVSGKPVSKIMKNWTGKPGHPVVSAKFKDQKSKLELTQSRFFSSPISKKQSEDKTIWSIPLSSLRKQGSINNFLMDKKTMIIPNAGEKLNVGETSMVRIDYPNGYLDGLKLSAPDKLGLIRDAFDLAQSGESETGLALELTLSYIKEDDYIVWASISSYLNKLDGLLAYEPFYNNFQVYGRKIYKEIAGKIGWEKKKDEKHTDSLLRGIVLNMLGTFGDKETIEKAKMLFKKGGIDSDLRGVVYNLVAQNGGKTEFSTLLKMYKTEDNQQEKDRIGRSLGRFKSKDQLLQALEFAISKDVRYQNSLGIIASVWHNPVGRYLAWKFVKKSWKLLKDRYAGGHYFTRVFQPAADFTRESDAKDIEIFIKKHPVPEAKRTIAQVLEQIYSNEAWLARDRHNMLNFFNQYK